MSEPELPTWGEYHMPRTSDGRTPAEIESLREHDRQHDDRLKRLEDKQDVMSRDISHIWREARAISTTIHGEHGDNGLRLDVRHLEQKMDELPARIGKIIGGFVAAIASIAGIATVVLQFFSAGG